MPKARSNLTNGDRPGGAEVKSRGGATKPAYEDLERENAELRGEVKALRRMVEELRDCLLHWVTKNPHASPAQKADAEIIDVFQRMTVKQHCALQMLLRGASNAEIAERMAVTESTAKVYVRAIMKKLGVGTRSQVVMRVAPTFDALTDEAYQRMARIPKRWDRDWSPEDPYKSLYDGNGEEPETD